MSEQTKQALDDAIRAHLADEIPGNIATQWAGIAVGVGLEDRTSSYCRFGSDMPDWQRIGLARTLTVAVEHNYLHDDDE